MKIIAKAGPIFDRVIYGMACLSGALTIFTVLIVCADVVSRYLFNRPIVWVIEITEYALLYIVFLGAAWVLKMEAHVKMDLIVTYMPPGIQNRVDIVTSILGAMVCFAITWVGADVTWNHFQRNIPSVQILRTPLFIILAIIPIGSFFLFVQFLRIAWARFQARNSESRSTT